MKDVGWLRVFGMVSCLGLALGTNSAQALPSFWGLLRGELHGSSLQVQRYLRLPGHEGVRQLGLARVFFWKVDRNGGLSPAWVAVEHASFPKQIPNSVVRIWIQVSDDERATSTYTYLLRKALERRLFRSGSVRIAEEEYPVLPAWAISELVESVPANSRISMSGGMRSIALSLHNLPESEASAVARTIREVMDVFVNEGAPGLARVN